MAVSSIFNDVLGPVMRGPSSSHSAAACRIGLLLRDLMEADIKQVEIDYDPSGSLVTTHESQGTDMGLYGGLLGWEAYDARMPDFKKGIEDAKIKINVNYLDYGATHPNNYRIRISNDLIKHSLSAISTGGGMIEVQEIDGANVSMNGDYHKLLIYCDNPAAISAKLPKSFAFDEAIECLGDRNFLEIKNSKEFLDSDIKAISQLSGVAFIRKLRAVLPILSRKDLEVPFIYCDDMLAFAKAKDLALWELALEFESARGNISKDDVFEKMTHIVALMDASIKEGLKGTEYADRILHNQSGGFKEKMDSQTLLNGGLLNTVILYVTAMMEVKSSMGVIVAAPTAGSCGALPGTILGAASIMESSKDDILKAMLAAGMIGVFISEHSTFSAEVGGCQSECGAGASMAAAGLITLAGGTLEQAITAASLALQNSLGMICDPIGNRVEAPCLGRNVLAASNALSCANMALANYDPVVTFDEVVKTMFDVGNSMAHELRCTALGGLSITSSSKKIEERLKKMKLC